MRLSVLFSFLFVAVSALAHCPEVKMEVRRLPDLNVPRSGHGVFVIDGMLTVFGGHTSGFVPTATAEYYSEGQWRLMHTVYTHDQGVFLPLADGRVMLAGGHERELGIGQTFTVEIYHPETHTFEGYGCLNSKRCFASAIELDSGRVVVSGNWYADDCMEVFSGTRQFSRLRDVSQTRSKPFMLHTGDDNAIIFSASDEHGDTISHIIVDRIYGESFTVPLFNTWLPKYQHHAPHSDDCRTEAGTYLIAVEDSTGQAAIARVQGEDFQLLATEGPLPMVSHGQRISYFGSIVCDRRAGRAYMVGYSDDRCLYVLSVAYGHEPASLTLYRSEPQPSIVMYTPVLTDEGHIALVGGTRESNFTPVSTALLLCVGSDDHAETTTTAQSRMWPWIAGAFVVLVIFVAAWLYARRRLRTAGKPEACPVEEEQQTVESNESSEADLITQINMLMEQEQLFRDSDLKIQDVANRLNTNRTYISDCIKAQYGLSFTQYVNNCRVEYAKQILAKNPDKKMLIVAAEAGFTTDVWFFHTFKAITGVTPTEWKAKQAEK